MAGSFDFHQRRLRLVARLVSTMERQGRAASPLSVGEDAISPFLDRLVAGIELHPFWGMPFAISTMIILGLAMPLIMAGAILDHWSTMVIGLGIGGLAGLIGVPEGALAWRGLLRPYASARWLHAVRSVVSDDMMVEVLAALQLQHRSEPDYAIRRTDVIQQVQLLRRRHRDRSRRAQGVRLNDARSAS